jgi:predicted dehydrogenase
VGTTTGSAPPVRIGLVGYGFGGRYFHAPLLAAASSCDFVGVVTTSEDRQRQVADEHPRVPTFRSIDELAAAGVEAVAISTPADTHSELTNHALDLGLHVVCDKPFAMDAAAARRTVALSKEKRLCLAPYQNRRWDSDFLTVRSLTELGTLGRLRRFESRFERFDRARGPGRSGGGVLLDFCSHLADQALVLLGPVTSVYAEYERRPSGLDDDVFLALTHSGAARSHLWGSWSQPAPGPRFRVVGTDAAYVVAGPMDGQESALLSGQDPNRVAEWGVEPEERWGRICIGDREERVPTLPGRWNDFYPLFSAAVRGAGSVPVDPADAVATAVVLDAAKQSAETGAVVGI